MCDNWLEWQGIARLVAEDRQSRITADGGEKDNRQA
jgi:hypothetical protein